MKKQDRKVDAEELKFEHTLIINSLIKKKV